MSRVLLLALLVCAPITQVAAAQEKVIAFGEYGHYENGRPVALEEGNGKWTATDKGVGKIEIRHDKGQLEMYYTINRDGIPVASRMSVVRGGKKELSISCIFHSTSLECADELAKSKTSLDVQKRYVFLPALEGSDTFLMLTMAATGAMKTPDKLTELAEIEFGDGADKQLRLTSNEVGHVKYIGRKECQTPIGKVSCNEVTLDDMRIRVADSGFLLGVRMGEEGSIELISINDDSHRLLTPVKK
jgi:hypothetical protein